MSSSNYPSIGPVLEPDEAMARGVPEGVAYLSGREVRVAGPFHAAPRPAPKGRLRVRWGHVALVAGVVVAVARLVR